MLIERKSPLTGELRTKDLDITEEQVQRYNNGELAQFAFPNLSPSDREFYISGLTDEEWNEIFPPDEEEESNDSESF